jgi:hypothetical protein
VNQSSYSASSVTMTKKWKCPSTAPFIRWTIVADERSRPKQTAAARARRVRTGGPATKAATPIGNTSMITCQAGYAIDDHASRKTACAHTARTIQAWRRSHDSSGSVRPRRSAPTTRWRRGSRPR